MNFGNELIYKQAVINEITEYGSKGTIYISVAELKRRIEHLPPVPQQTGQWITDDSELGIKCNKCGKSFSDYINAGTGYVFLEEIPNFCPNCGVDMKREQK